MAINRAEKEALDQVCLLASPNGELRGVTDKIDECVGSISALLGSDEITLPEETEERMRDAVKRLAQFAESYKAKAVELAECNRKLSSAITTSMNHAASTASDTAAAAGKAAGNVGEIQTGVR